MRDGEPLDETGRGKKRHCFETFNKVLQQCWEEESDGVKQEVERIFDEAKQEKDDKRSKERERELEAEHSGTLSPESLQRCVFLLQH